MSERDLKPGRTLSESESEISRILLDVLERAEAGQRVDLDALCADRPADFAAELRARCQRVLGVQEMLAQQLDPPAPSTLLGRRLGDYVLEEELGHGGMGVVFRASRVGSGEPVALKLVTEPGLRGSRALERFRREPLAAGRLDHPGIVRILESGEEAGLPWFAMELIEGRSLAQTLDVRREEGSRGADSKSARGWYARAAELAAGIARALQHAHERGVIHRDLKPANVLLCRDGTPRLVDFGLAKDLLRSSISHTGDIAGTPHYMSPEQVLARRVPIDHRTDVYSLGAILYELLTLARPFEGASLQQVLYAICFEPLRAVRSRAPAVPRDLETICHKALERSPEHRYASAAEMADDLERFLAHEAIVARPPPLPARLLRRATIRRREAGIALGVALLLLLALWIRARIGEERERGAAFERLRSQVPAAMEGVPAALLRDLRSGIERLRARHAPLSEELSAELAAIEGRIAAEGQRLFARGRELLSAGLAPPAGTPYADYRAPSESARREALRVLSEAELLTEVPAELLEMEAAYPLVTIVADPADAGADVHARELDLATGLLGERQHIGTLPLVDHPLPPGTWRIVVERPGYGFCELTRHLWLPGRTELLRAWIRPTAEVRARMDLAQVPAGPFLFGSAGPGGTEPFRQLREVDLDEFWIGRREVSNAEWMQFLQEAGAEPGVELELRPEWHAELRPEHAGLPVVWLTLREAQLFAEWAGCRLATLYEWEKGARGTDGRRFPWGEEEDLLRTLANVEGGERVEIDPDEFENLFLLQYLGGVLAVDWCPLGSESPFGLCNVLGNVAEWTETHEISELRGDPLPIPAFHFVAGEHFRSAPTIGRAAGFGLTAHGSLPISRMSPYVGLRCAKSSEP